MPVRDQSTAPEGRVNPKPEPATATGKIDAGILELAEKTGRSGLTEMQQKTCDYCCASFGDTSFTVGMFCAQTGVVATEALAALRELHSFGIIRCPVNDGGQMLYQMVPGIVHPKAAGVRF